MAYNVLGGCLYRAERLDEAIASFRTAIEIKPRFASAENNLGLALAHQGKLQEAMRHYRLALEYSPAYPQAMIYYRQALAIAPYNAAAYKNLGLALAALGDVQQAIGCLETALRLNPDLPDAAQQLEALTARAKMGAPHP